MEKLPRVVRLLGQRENGGVPDAGAHDCFPVLSLSTGLSPGRI